MTSYLMEILASDVKIGEDVCTSDLASKGKVISNNLKDPYQVTIEWDSGGISSEFTSHIKFGLDMEFSLAKKELIRSKLASAHLLVQEAKALALDLNFTLASLGFDLPSTAEDREYGWSPSDLDC